MPNIIITGASDGIGAELARQLSRRHGLQAMLVLAARNAAGLQAVAAECNALGARTLILPTDVTDAYQCRHLVDTTVRQFGSLDILINNAGVSGHALLEDVPADKLAWYEDMMRVNLWGSVYCTHAALPALKESHGRIVAVSSLAGMVGVPGRTAYCASKFAMAGFFEALRAEVKDAGVSVTIAYPGVVRHQYSPPWLQCPRRDRWCEWFARRQSHVHPRMCAPNHLWHGAASPRSGDDRTGQTGPLPQAAGSLVGGTHGAGCGEKRIPTGKHHERVCRHVSSTQRMSTLLHGTGEPSPWVQRWSHLIATSGHVLDLACGHGRHMRYLQAIGLSMLGTGPRCRCARCGQILWRGASR